MLLHHYMGEIDGAFRAWGFQKGGTGGDQRTRSRRAARSFGAEIRTDASVEHVLVRGGARERRRARRTAMRSRAPLVVSGLDPRRTFLQLVDPKELPDDLVDGMRRYKFRGSSGKVNLALSGLPKLTCFGGNNELALRALRGAISISPSVEYLERAYDDAKYGEFSRNPYMDIVIPSMIDPGMAPPGKHVMSDLRPVRAVQHQRRLERRQARGVRRRGHRHARAATRRTSSRSSSAGRCSRRRTSSASRGSAEGNIFQGELALHQLFFLRPVPEWAKYRTPIRGYWQCGAGTHPGGGIMGAAGRLAALEILRAS